MCKSTFRLCDLGIYDTYRNFMFRCGYIPKLAHDVYGNIPKSEKRSKFWSKAFLDKEYLICTAVTVFYGKTASEIEMYNHCHSLIAWSLEIEMMMALCLVPGVKKQDAF